MRPHVCFPTFPTHFCLFLTFFKKRVTDGLTDRRTDRPMDQQMDGRMDGWTDGATDGWTHPLIEMRGHI